MPTSAVLKAWESCDLTDTAFVLVCTVFCWPIIPAVGLAYSGYSHRRNGKYLFHSSSFSLFSGWSRFGLTSRRGLC